VAFFPIMSGVTPTAGGLVLVDDMGGTVHAFDSATGSKLWSQSLGGAIGGGVITYGTGQGQKIAASVGMTSRTARRREGGTMADRGAATGPRISITKDGPYAVTGQIPLARAVIGVNGAGESETWVKGDDLQPPDAYCLCRCGQSARKPYCDGSHAKVAFDGKETARKAGYLETAQELDGPVLALTDAEALCAFARFCDRDGKVWRTVTTASSDNQVAAFTAQVAQCPSGRLVAWHRRSGQALEPELQPSILLVEDPQQGVSGPLWVRGRIEVVGADGHAYEIRNRVTLCRCGRSRNKPFCDGTHAAVGFSDE